MRKISTLFKEMFFYIHIRLIREISMKESIGNEEKDEETVVELVKNEKQ